MKRIDVMICCLGCLVAPAERTYGEETGTSADSIPAAITQLSADTFAERDLAAKRLINFGEPALPMLRIAAKESRDTEVRRTAEHLILKITSIACHSSSTDMEFLLVDSGEFMMGSPEKESDRQPSETLHKVRITQPFLLGAFEVTQAEFKQVMKFKPSWFSSSGEGKAKLAGQGTDRFPVECVTWFDAVAFCNALSKLDGLPAYYKISDVKRKNNAIIAAKVEIAGGLGYRLPTEAEWEYACRAGTDTPFQFGAGKGSRGGNFKVQGTTAYGIKSKVSGLGRTTSVGSYNTNLWGFRDMHGNVAEWCGDWYAEDFYKKSTDSNPSGPSKGTHRVLRGGSWLVNQNACRSAARYWHVPGMTNNYIGFRVARNASRYLAPVGELE
jgi:sulfatase modifying factor 1